jgi:phosphoribosylformylglycinamidine synthase
MWEFVEAVRGIADACETITLKNNQEHPTPIIAGNVSFYNESRNGAIPPSPIVSCLGRLQNVNKAISMHFKKPDSTLFMVGDRKNELGGSVYYSLHGELGKNIPKPNLLEVKRQIFALTDCIDRGLLLSSHDISDGGIAPALTEMTFKNNVGLTVNIPGVFDDSIKLFSETGGFILEVDPDNSGSVTEIFSNYKIKAFDIGTTTNSEKIIINQLTDLTINEARIAWSNGLRDKM